MNSCTWLLSTEFIFSRSLLHPTPTPSPTEPPVGSGPLGSRGENFEWIAPVMSCHVMSWQQEPSQNHLWCSPPQAVFTPLRTHLWARPQTRCTLCLSENGLLRVHQELQNRSTCAFCQWRWPPCHILNSWLPAKSVAIPINPGIRQDGRITWCGEGL